MFSRQSSDDDAPATYRKPRADLYTVLLVIALLALLLGILCLYLDMKVYDFNIRGAPSLTMAFDGSWSAGQALPLRECGQATVAFRSATECGFRGAKGNCG